MSKELEACRCCGWFSGCDCRTTSPEVEAARGALEGLRYEWGCWCAHDHTKDDPGSPRCLAASAALSRLAEKEGSRG